MSDWAAKRFWTTADVVAADTGWTVHLDDKPLRTPAKTALILPTEGLAGKLAGEWAAQQGRIKPETMPATRMANSALDKVQPQRLAVADMLAAYGETDLLCHRADGPAELIARQVESWDPMLDWAATTLQVRLTPTQGVMPIDQPQASLMQLQQQIRGLDMFQLAALHDLISLTGSAIMGLAAITGAWSVDAIWRASRIDDDWQIEQWGRDELADADAALKQQAFHDAHEFYALATG